MALSHGYQERDKDHLDRLLAIGDMTAKKKKKKNDCEFGVILHGSRSVCTTMYHLHPTAQNASQSRKSRQPLQGVLIQMNQM